MEQGNRKVRSDKKRAIAPQIHLSTYEQIARIGYICDIPLKTVGELLCREGYGSYKMMDSLRGLLRRDLLYDDNHYFLGNMNNPPYRASKGEKRRIDMRFFDFEHARFAALSYALDCSVSTATGLILETAIRRKDLLHPILGRYIQKDLHPKRVEQLRQLCRQLDAISPNEFVTLPLVLAHIIDRSLREKTKVKSTIEKVMEQHQKVVLQRRKTK
ncbi:hypothetical protein [Bacillus sp. FSL K6-6540]|uniref:hypothetical protein n=1 Tax=Bacillus sp. FSL K6-6540 TaxID=2921512 RepID=UPI0030F570A2